MTTRWRNRYLGILVGGLLLGGCTQVLDTGKIEEEIESGIEEQTNTTVESVDCPEDRALEEGDTFECTATAPDGSSATVEVTQTDDEGNITWEVVP